jgi:hypothetical protein
MVVGGNELLKPKNTPRSKRLSRKLCESCASAIPQNQHKHGDLRNVALVAKPIFQHAQDKQQQDFPKKL